MTASIEPSGQGCAIAEPRVGLLTRPSDNISMLLKTSASELAHDAMSWLNGLASAKSHTIGNAWRPKGCTMPRPPSAFKTHSDELKSACLSTMQASKVATALAVSCGRKDIA